MIWLARLQPDGTAACARYNALLVLMYEAIVAGALSFDFAPAPVVLTIDAMDSTVWMNVSQEAEVAIEKLAARHLVERIKTTAGVGCAAGLCLQTTLEGTQISHVPCMRQQHETMRAGNDPANTEMWNTTVDRQGIHKHTAERRCHGR